MEPQKQQVDAMEVIEKLKQTIANLHQDIAIREVQMEKLAKDYTELQSRMEGLEK